MGRLVDMRLPRLGETMEEGRIVAWLKQPGQSFRRGETLLEVETDKTVVECPALMDGRLFEHLVEPDDRVAVDTPIARIEVADGEIRESGIPASAGVPDREDFRPPAPAFRTPNGRARASGKARATARRLGVDLGQIAGTGRGGRILSSDVLAARAQDQHPTIVLIHGLFADAESFALLKLMLERAGRVVVAIDLPGHGRSGGTAEGLDQLVEGARARLPEGYLTLVGHSLGAVVAARLAHSCGDRLRRLVLISPAGFGSEINGSFIFRMASARSAEDVLAALAILGPAPVSRAFAEEQLRRIAERRTMFQRLISTIIEGDRQLTSIISDLERLALPVTAIFARDDNIIPVAHALAAPSNVEVRLVDGTGHVPHWYRADLITRLVTS